MSYRRESKRRTWRRAAAALPQVAARRGRLDVLALLSLLIAALAMLVSFVQILFSLQQADVPYATTVFEEQVKRMIEAADYMDAVPLSVERWEYMAFAGRLDAETVVPEIEELMFGYAELSRKSWLISDRSQRAIGAAAESFNAFAVQCLVPKYTANTVPDECGALFTRQKAAREAAVTLVKNEVRFAERSTMAQRREAMRWGWPF